MPTSTTGRLNNRAGYTLVELAIVVLLISLFSALVVPLLPGWGGSDLRASARRLTGTVKYLFNESALQHLEHRLIFDLNHGTYQGQRLEENGELVVLGSLGRGRKLPGDTHIKDIVLIGRGKFSSGEVTVRIHPEGWMDEAVIHLTDDRDRNLTVHTQPYTGTTEIYEGYREIE